MLSRPNEVLNLARYNVLQMKWQTVSLNILDFPMFNTRLSRFSKKRLPLLLQYIIVLSQIKDVVVEFKFSRYVHMSCFTHFA